MNNLDLSSMVFIFFQVLTMLGWISVLSEVASKYKYQKRWDNFIMIGVCCISAIMLAIELTINNLKVPYQLYFVWFSVHWGTILKFDRDINENTRRHRNKGLEIKKNHPENIIFILILCLSFLFSCKTKTIVKEKEKEEIKTETLEKKSEVKNEVAENQSQEITKTENSNLTENHKQETFIEGKAEINQPFEIFETENGVTKKIFRVVGNATVSIKTITENKQSAITSGAKTISENKQQNTSDKRIELTKKTDSTKVTNSTQKNTKTHNFTFGAWLMVILTIIVCIVGIWLFIYFRNIRPKK